MRPRVLQAGSLRPRMLQAGKGGYPRMLPETGMLCAQVLWRCLACGLVQIALVVEPEAGEIVISPALKPEVFPLVKGAKE